MVQTSCSSQWRRAESASQLAWNPASWTQPLRSVSTSLLYTCEVRSSLTVSMESGQLDTAIKVRVHHCCTHVRSGLASQLAWNRAIWTQSWRPVSDLRRLERMWSLDKPQLAQHPYHHEPVAVLASLHSSHPSAGMKQYERGHTQPLLCMRQRSTEN